MRRFAVLAWFGVSLLAAPALTQDRWRRDDDRWRHEEAWRRAYPDRPDDLVRSWYRRFLGREPDPMAGVWTNELRSGQDPNAVLATILGSDEYYTRAGSTPDGLVRTLFQDLTGRPPSPQEMASWTRRAATGDRNDIAYALLTRYPQTWTQRPYIPDDHRYDYRRPAWPYRR
jgi:hypothetical protein